MPEYEATLTPAEVIERIRNEEYLLDIEQESEKIKFGAKSLRKKLNSALELLSIDLYSKQTHYLMELIQNADDNDYFPEASPQLTFKLTPERLVIVNNEKGFQEPHVKALCSVGESSKTKKSGYIGEKGIGFKSVFTVSDAPEIHSNGYHFCFDRRDAANLLGYVVPDWCEPSKDVSEGATTIILPAKRGSPFTSQALEDVDENLLLFLPKLRKLALERQETRVTYRRRDQEDLVYLTIESESAATPLRVQEKRFVRIELPFPMMDIVDEKRPGVEVSTLVLAFPLDSTGAADPQASSSVFAFLPIRQFGFKFAVHADFILSSSREEIQTGRPWNTRLRNGIAFAFKAALEHFKKNDALAFSYLTFLPNDPEITDKFFKPVVEQLVSALSGTKSLRSASGEWMLPKDLRFGDAAFQDLFPAAVVRQFYQFDYVDSRLRASDHLLKRLGAKQITYLDYINIFREHTDWILRQPRHWKAKLYARLAVLTERAKIVNELTNLHSVPTNAGELAVPKQTAIFYPLSRGKKYDFEQELTIVDGELLDEAEKVSAGVSDFFAALNVRSAEPYQLVVSHILPRHKGDKWKTSQGKALIGHLRYLKDKLSEYLEGALKAGKSEQEAFKLIREGIWLGTKQKPNGIWQFNRAESLYLSKEYKPRFCIESLLGTGIPNARLISNDYLSSRAKDTEVEVESWRQFLVKIGVRTTPAVERRADGDRHCSTELQSLINSPVASVRRAVLECLDQHWTSYTGHLTYSASVGRSSQERDTAFVVALRSMKAPTRRRTNSQLSESYYPSAELKNVFGDRLAYVDASIKNEGLLETCRITFRLDAKACVKRLQQLKSEGGDTTPQLQAIYRQLERYWDKDAIFIKKAFSQAALIRVRGEHAAWARPDEVSWRANSPFLDALYPPLQPHYRDFSVFFNDRLGIPKELPTAKWVGALTKLHQVDSSQARIDEANAIYRRASRELSPRFGREEAPTPDWLDVFHEEDVFLNHWDELVPNGESLFANDSPELADLFLDEPKISLLAVPPNEVPRIDRLLKAANVKLLSKSVHREVVEISGGLVNDELTTRVREAIPFLGRIFYSKSHEMFEKALKSGLFLQLSQMEAIEVPELKLKVTVANVTRTTTADIACGGRKILIKHGVRSVNDQVASKVCEILGAPDDLADAFARVLIEADAESIEDFLVVRRIGNLPADLLLQMTFGGVEQPGDLGKETTPESKGEEDGGADRGSLTSTADSPISQVDSEQESTRPAPQLSEPTSNTLLGLGTPNSDSRLMQSPPEEGATSKPSLVPSAASGTLEPKVHAPLEGRPQSSRPDARAAESSAPRTSEVEHDDGVVSQISSVEISRRDDLRDLSRPEEPSRVPAPAQETRTKAGRLMSYAAPQGEAQEESSEISAEKAAARDATGKAAVEYFLATQGSRWKLLTPMHDKNPGFDIKAVAYDESDEVIEVKGQSAAWTEDGVALTPRELEAAKHWGVRYWLCVVEYAHDEKRRVIYLVNNPYGLTQQFRFDSGWKSAAVYQSAVPVKPRAGLFY